MTGEPPKSRCDVGLSARAWRIRGGQACPGDVGGKTLRLYPVKLGCLWLRAWTTRLASGPHVSLHSGTSPPGRQTVGSRTGRRAASSLEAGRTLTHLKTNPGTGSTLRSLSPRDPGPPRAEAESPPSAQAAGSGKAKDEQGPSFSVCCHDSSPLGLPTAGRAAFQTM